MLKRIINGTEYEIVTSFESDGQGNAIAKTIVEEGETSENIYRLRVAAKHPVTQAPFHGNIEMLNDFIISVDNNTWNDYWEDPAPEEGE